MSDWRQRSWSQSEAKAAWDAELKPQVLADRAERSRRLAGLEELVRHIELVLLDHDPVGLGFTNQADEYRPEAETITLRLSEVHSETELLGIIHEEFVTWFNDSVAGPVANYEVIAAEIWAILR